MTKPKSCTTNTIPSSNNDEDIKFHVICTNLDDFELVRSRIWISKEEALKYWPETPDD
jgi:hypothetical protein